MLYISRNKSHTNWESHKVLSYQEIIGQISGSAKVYWCLTAVRKEVSPNRLRAFPTPQKDNMRLASGISGMALWV